MTHRSEVRAMLMALYPVAGLLVITPLIDVMGMTWPLRAGHAAWRFGSLGLGFGFVVIEILGLAMAMTVAAILEHRRTLRALSAIAIAAGAMTAAGIARFMIDYAQIRHVVPAGQSAGFDTATLRALITATLAVPVLLTLGGRGWWVSTPPRHPWLETAESDHVIPLRFRDRI